MFDMSESDSADQNENINTDQDDFELRPIPDTHDPKISSLLFNPIKNKGFGFDNHDSNEENFICRTDFSRRIGSLCNDGTPPSSKSYEFFKRPFVPRGSNTPVGQAKRIKSVLNGNICSRSLNRSQSAPQEDDASSEDDSSLMELDNSFESAAPQTSRPKLFPRSQSESAVQSIMKAVERFDNDPMMIGDASRRFVLPLVTNGKHNDLKEISGETLVKLMEGGYDHLVNSYEVIDCRYPYEYNGGHIRGAINIHTQKQLHEKYLSNRSAIDTSNQPTGRHILVFHCEFSSQRAPDLCRFLREADRTCNRLSFPALHYPEMYVLHGGYKAFYEKHKDHCDPQNYLEMSHPSYSEDYKLHKSQSKTEVVSTKSLSSTNLPKSRKNVFKKCSLETC